MFDYFVLGYHMAKEALATGALGELAKRQISRNRLLTPVEMDLSIPLSEGKEITKDGLQFVELRGSDLQTGRWIFSVKSRGLKALYKIRRGCRGFAFARDNLVVGDVWCVLPRDGKPASHPDLKMLGLSCEEGEAYAFDMLIDPAYRGKNLAVPLQRALQHTLKKEGFIKVYGFFYDDNLPALWMHRMLKFKEHPKRKVFRFFFYVRSTLADAAHAPVTLTNTTQKGE